MAKDKLQEAQYKAEGKRRIQERKIKRRRAFAKKWEQRRKLAEGCECIALGYSYCYCSDYWD